MTYNIFLSHSEADKSWVEWIASNAQDMGINVYMYEYDTQAGFSVADKVQSAIENCQALVVLLTPNSEVSPYVQQEIGFAKARGKLVIPLVQPGVSKKCLAMLEGVEYITFDPTEPETALTRLLDYLAKLKESREADHLALWGLATLALLAFLSKGKQ
ncbi:MAG: toll/interleukin-1 receptor domain-containing protein [Chloroflexi bacterium]|nr:toll/interleukin-1 receptor domain-containing protein [Chloroflexota bacterium]